MKDIKEIFDCFGAGSFICRDGAEARVFEGAEAGVFFGIAEELEKSGFSLKKERKFGGNDYKIFVSGETAIYLSYSPYEKVVRAIIKGGAVFPKCEGIDGEAKYPVLLTQVSPSYWYPDCGMGYVIRLKDGRFAIIDGGYDEFENVDRLFDIICTQNERGGKPIIAAWFVSHAHDDHCGIPRRFIEKYFDKCEIQNVFYNWEVLIGGSSRHAEGAFMALCEEKSAEMNVITPRTPDGYDFGGVHFDVIFVGEDMFPKEIKGLNNSSLVLRMEAEGKVVLFPADTEAPACGVFCKRFEKEIFKCDMFQVAHHGYWGGSEEFFSLVDPEILLWPCPNYWYKETFGWGANPILLNSPNVKAIYVSGREEKTFDLTKDFDYKIFDPKYKSGEIIYEENFPVGRRISELGWACLDGGSTGYSTASVWLEDGKCHLQAGAEAYKVIEFFREHIIKNNPDYLLEMSGKVIGDYERIALFFDYGKPTVFSDEYAVDLGFTPDEEFGLTLSTDEKTQSAVLSVNGKERTLPYREACGLHLILKSAEIEINGIKITRK